MQVITLTGTYTRITPEGTGVSLIQGHNAEVYLGSSAPSASDGGIRLTDNWPIPIDVDKFTHVWVRGSGIARFAG